MNDHTLLPCPFCGGNAGVIQLTGHESPRTVECDECHCRSRWGTEEEVIAAWNRRTPPAAVPDGWVMVPKEPTPEMCNAALKEISDITVRSKKAAAWDAVRAYRAMISAAPAAPTAARDE